MQTNRLSIWGENSPKKDITNFCSAGAQKLGDFLKGYSESFKLQI